MNRNLIIGVITALLGVVMAWGKTGSTITKQAAAEQLGALSLPFIANNGQVTDPTVRFYARTLGGTVLVRADGRVAYLLPKTEQGQTQVYLLEERVKSNLPLTPRGTNKSLTAISLYKGNKLSAWQQGLAAYDQVEIGEVAPGVSYSLVAHGSNVEKIFTLAPGAESGAIQIELLGSDKLAVDAAGNLVVTTSLGPISFTKPIAYQLISGQRQYVDVAYNVSQNSYGFTVGAYDRSRKLVIDPLLASTFIGGNGTDYVNAIAGDSYGNVYVAGVSLSSNFLVTESAFVVGDNKGDVYHGGGDAFVAKLLPDLSTVVAAVYIGGNGHDEAFDIAIRDPGMGVDLISNGGLGADTDWNFTGDFGYNAGAEMIGYKQSQAAPSSAFSQLVALDARSEYYLSYDISGAGIDEDSDLRLLLDSDTALFERELSLAAGSHRVDFVSADVAPTWLSVSVAGGMEFDSFRIDNIFLRKNQAEVFVCGSTASRNFPTVNGFENNHQGTSIFDRDAFVAHLSPNFTSLYQATYLGSSGDDDAYALAISATAPYPLYVAGNTLSSTFPTEAPLPGHGANLGSLDIFVARLSADLGTLEKSTYLGGSGTDILGALLLDTVADLYDNVYVAGITESATSVSNFPRHIDNYNFDDHDLDGVSDAFITRIDGNLSTITASSYLGGEGVDSISGLAKGSNGLIYAVGTTRSETFQTTIETEGSEAYDLTLNATADNVDYDDAFVLAINDYLTSISGFTYLGGDESELGLALALDKFNNVYVTGSTGQVAALVLKNFLTANNGYDRTHNGDNDVFVAKINSSLGSLQAATLLGGGSGDEARAIMVDLQGKVFIAGSTGSSNYNVNYDGADQTFSEGAADGFISKFDSDLSTDDPGFQLSAISGDTNEALVSANFSIELLAEPSGAVVLNTGVDDDSEGTVSPASITFDVGNWHRAQTVTVTGKNDAVADGAQDYHVTLTIDKGKTKDGNYSDWEVIEVPVRNQDDDDQAGLLVEIISNLVSEDGDVAIFAVALESEPDNLVTINITLTDYADVPLAGGDAVRSSQSKLSFRSSDWFTAQTVAVSVIDDKIARGDKNFKVHFAIDSVATLDGTGYNDQQIIPGQVFELLSTDNDVVGVESIAGNTNRTSEELTTAIFGVALSSQPDGVVVLDVSSSDSNEGLVTPSQLIFEPSEWSIAQDVYVTGVNDDIADGDRSYQVLLVANGGQTTDTSGYKSAIIDPVAMVNLDNDVAGFEVSSIVGQTSEAGGQATFTIRLSSEPVGRVVVLAQSSDEDEGVVEPANASLIFTDADWWITQAVTVTGVNDNIPEGDVAYQVQLSVDAVATSDTSGYKQLAIASVDVINVDDSPGITVGDVSGATSEAGASATFTVVLDNKPNADVVLNVATSNSAEGETATKKLIFTTSNWDGERMIIVSGVDDRLLDGDQAYSIELSVNQEETLDTTGYKLLSMSVVDLVNEDDDQPGLIYPAMAESTSENRTTSAFAVSLESEPKGNVVFNISSSDTSEALTSPFNLTFDSDNWNVDQLVTVTGVDDNEIDNEVGYDVLLDLDVGRTVDPDYKAMSVTQFKVIMSNLDNDNAGITVDTLTGTCAENSGKTSFSITLSSVPSGTVVLDIVNGDDDEVSVDPVSLTFTADDWNREQIVTVTGRTDDIVDGDQEITVSVVLNYAETEDAAYKARDPKVLLLVTNEDIDTIGVVLSKSTIDTTEDGGETSINIYLNSRPDGNVVINAVCDDPTEGALLTSVVTLDAFNWSSGRTLKVKGVDDKEIDGDVEFTVTFTVDAAATTDRTGYRDVANLPPVTLTNADNDADSVTTTVEAAPVDVGSGSGGGCFVAVSSFAPRSGGLLSLISNLW